MPFQNPVKNKNGSKHLLPGFGLTLGLSFSYFCLIVLVPLAALLIRSAAVPLNDLGTILSSVRFWKSLQVTFLCSLAAAVLNLLFGSILAWVLVRYRFWGRSFLNSLIDIPFALPTAIAGVSLASLYMENGPIGQLLVPLGIDIAFTRAGIVTALVFVGLPFVVRTVQPALENLDRESEEAAFTLGANAFQRFYRVILPALTPALVAGFMMAFARGIGEYGSVIFIAGNIPMVTEITPLLIVIQLEEFNYEGASVIAVVLLIFSFILLLGTNLAHSHLRKKEAAHA